MVTIRLDPDGADELVRHYGWQDDLLKMDVSGLAPLLDDTSAFSIDGAGIADRLVSVARLMAADGTDLRWRVAYVRARGGEPVNLHIPNRSPEVRRRSIGALVAAALIVDDPIQMAAYIDELAVRAALHPEAFAAAAHALGVDEIRQIQARIGEAMINELDMATSSALDYDEELQRDRESLFNQQAASNRMLETFAVVLAAQSHDADGRAAIREAWGFEPDDRGWYDHLLLGMVAGVWDDGFLREMATRVFSGTLKYDLGLLLPASTMPGFRDAFPNLVDPQAVMLDALARNPAAARAFLLQDDGLEMVLADEPRDWFLAQGVRTELWVGRERDRAVAGLLRAGYIDALPSPSRSGLFHQALERVNDHMVGLWVGDDGRPNLGAFASIDEHGIPGSATALALADVITLLWPFMAPASPAGATPSDLAGAAFSEIMRHEEALAQVTVGFGLYLESSFARAFDLDGSRAIDDARHATQHAFQLLDAGLDDVKYGSDAHGLFRGAFSAVVGHGASLGLTKLAWAGGWAGVALSFASDTLIDELGEHLFPDPVRPVPTSQQLLEDLFVEGGTLEGGQQRQPALGQVILANAVLAADPHLIATLPPSPFLVDGRISIPHEPAAREEFGGWFFSALWERPEFHDRVFDLSRDLASDGASVSAGGDG